MADSSKGEMMKTMAAQLGLSSDQLAMLESVLGMVDKKGLGEVAKTDVGQIVRWFKCRQFYSIFVLLRALGGNPTDGEMDAMTSKLKENKKYDTIVTIGAISTPTLSVMQRRSCPVRRDEDCGGVSQQQ